ncbi:MAG: TonB-dependent receptor [Deltaproteobacteria bacterium]|nr:TonB-dependent receptor [Deltaproteobacteria bacterium]
MNRLASRFIIAGFAFAFSFAFVAISASAQDAEEPTTQEAENVEEAPEDQTFGEVVTVTARKREESLQEVPFSVVAPTEEILRDRGVDSLEGVSSNVAGFTVQNLGPGQSQVAMRGVSAGQIVRDQPGVKEQVGVYLDESVISLSLFTPDIDLFDMSRVEVLRGPQGTLFGSGSLAGTVRYISNQPEIGVSETFGDFNLSTLTDGDTGGHAKIAANIPLGDTSAMRVSAYFTSMAGFTDAIQPDLSVNQDVNGGERAGVRLAFRFEPNENLTITPRLIYQEIDTDGWNRSDAFNILANPFTTTRPAVDLGEREQFTQFEEPFTDEFLLADLNIEYDFGDLTLTSITSYTDRDVLVVRDATALTASVTGGSIGVAEDAYTIDAPLDDATTAEVITQELRLAGATDKVNWVGGLFYSSTERDYGQSLLVDGFETTSGIPTAGTFGAGRDVLFFSDLAYDLDQVAVFGEVTLAVTDRLDLTGGLRWYDFEEERTQTFDGIFAAPGTTVGSTSADGIAPRIIASFKATEKTQLNAQVSKGFRLGGINDPLNLPLCTPEDLRTFGGQDEWDDEELWNYEVGAKSTIMGGRGTFNIAGFYMDIDDLQATVTAGSCSSRVVFNVPKAKSQGLEIEFASQLTNFFDVAFSASYTDSTLESTLTSTDSNGNVSIVSGIEKGNRLPTVPRFQAFGAATYRWEMQAGWAGYLIGTYQHVGSRFTQIGDQSAGFGTVDLTSFAPNNIGGPFTSDIFRFNPELPAYDLANLRLGFVNEKWDLSLFINNISDETALLAIDQERGTRARVSFLTNQPRTYGVSARVSF